VLGRVMKPLLSFVVASGGRLSMYIDDGRGLAKTKEQAEIDYALVLCIFVSAGFSISVEKSDAAGEAAQCKEYLGFLIDSETMSVSVPLHKMSRVLSAFDTFLKTSWHSCREVASIVGRMCSLEPALGTEILVGTRLATIEYVVMAETHSWSWRFCLSPEAMLALKEVRILIESWNGHPIRCFHTCLTLASILPGEAEMSLERKIPAGRYRPTRATLASDASDSAVASFCVDGLPAFDFFSFLTEEEASWSSSRRELLALQRTLEGKSELLSSKGPITLWWLTDNSNVSKFLSKGSGKLEIMLQVLELLRLARSLQLDLRPIWVSRDHHFLQRADARSKSIDTDNWEVGSADFDYLFKTFGPFTVDLFASSSNFKVERFFSFTYEDGSSGVDAFAYDWVGEMAYAAPPVSLLSRVLRKLAVTRMTGLLLVPLWKSAKFWSYCFPDGRHLCDVFSSMSRVRLRTVNWDISPNPKDLLGNSCVSFLALKIDSSGSSALESSIAPSRCLRILFGKTCIC
jgi:hypothetical protein